MKSSSNTPPFLRKRAVLVEVFQRLAQAAAHRRDLLQLFLRQIVEILVHRRTRIDLVLDAVEAGHQHRGEGEIGIGHRIGEADFDALGLRVRRIGNAAGGRAVARGVGEQHRGFITRDQALVGVGRRVGEGVDRLGVLDDAADVVEAGLREVGVLVAGEYRLAVLPDRLVAVHARAVVAIDRLRHEGGGLAVDVRDLVDAILVDLHLVGHQRHGVELHAELVLGGSDFVVMLLDLDAHLGHGAEHFRAHVLHRILRRDREVAALGADAVAEVAAFIFGVRIGRQFGGVELEAGVVGRARRSARRRTRRTRLPVRRTRCRRRPST